MTQYKIQFHSEQGQVVGEQIVDSDYVKIAQNTGFMERSLKAHITSAFVYNLKDELPQGDIAELGVYQGGMTKFLASCFPDRTVYAFDTFEGLPVEKYRNDLDRLLPGEFGHIDEQDVLKYLNDSNIVIRKGVFPKTVPDDTIYALVHLDADLYLSTYEGLNYFWPRMADNGFIILDDFDEQPTTPGVKQAFNEYFTRFGSKEITVDIIPVLDDFGIVAIKKGTI